MTRYDAGQAAPTQATNDLRGGSGSKPLAVREILAWIDEARAVLAAGPDGPLLDFDGTSAVDLLVSPILLNLLARKRAATVSSQSPLRAIAARARNWAYRAKTGIRERHLAHLSAQPTPTDVLLWSRDITHTAVMQPLADAFHRRGTNCQWLTCQATAFEGLLRRGTRPVFAPGAWPTVVHSARRDGATRASRIAGTSSWRLPAVGRLAANDAEAVLRQTLIDLLPLAAEAVANARAALDAFGARVLVVGNDVTLEGRAGCRVASQLGRATAVLMHGNISGDALQSLHCADRVLVYGEIHRRELIEQGVAPQRIEVCGSPALDNRCRQTGRIHPLLAARLGLGEAAPWVLVATSGPGHRISHSHHGRVIRQLAQLCRNFSWLPFVVKLHRKDRAEYYRQQLAGEIPANMHIVSEKTPGYPQDIFDWLKGCSLVLTGASTVAVEAMLMHVPVVTMDFADEIQDVDFIDAQATLHVCSAEALATAVQQIFETGGQSWEVQECVQRYLGEAFVAVDGRSADRCAAALAPLLTP